jgi:GntP family gluconate:H+ symporter
MHLILIASIGIALVLLMILWLRFHPVIALLLSSLFLLIATPERLQLEPLVEGDLVRVTAVSEDDIAGFDRFVEPGEYVLWREGGTATLYTEVPALPVIVGAPVEPPISVRARREGGAPAAAYTWQPVEWSGERLNPQIDLISVSALAELRQLRWSAIAPRLVEGFTKTFRKLGIPVTMAAIIGVCLLRSGAAQRLVQTIVALFGPRGTAPALTASGFLLGVPVFFDTVFYLLLPLAKAIGATDSRKFMTAVMAIIVGATMAHSLVPPTPGPLFVIAQLNEFLGAENQISISMMMLAGCLVGGIAASAGFFYGKLCSRWIQVDLGEDAKAGAADRDSKAGPAAAGNAGPGANTGISVPLAALPIVLPIFLLGGSEIIAFLAAQSEASEAVKSLNNWTLFFNNPSLVFLLVAVVAVFILRRFQSPNRVAESVSRGLSDAGVIVLLTCAGGAFGAALQQLHLAEAIASEFPRSASPSAWALLSMAFGITAIIRFAQGSATVAMLTSSAIIGPVLEIYQLPFHPIYFALAIGCGSKPLPWMNDSGFWQVNTMTGMTPVQTLQTFSVALTLMGVVGFLATLIGAWLLPMV